MNENLETRIVKLPDEANMIQILDQGGLIKANDFLLGIKGLKKQIDEIWDPVIEAAYKSHREALSQKQKFTNPLLFAEQIVKKRISSYLAEQERLRREAEEANRKLEEERCRLEEEALKKAQEAEEKARQAEFEAAALLDSSEKKVKAEEEAKKAKEEADKIIEAAAEKEKQFVPRLVVEVPKTSGLTAREDWKFEIVDFGSFLSAIISGTVPLQAIKTDDVFIGKMVRTMKNELKWPGVRVYSEKNISVRLS
jgi:hypothetical protein